MMAAPRRQGKSAIQKIYVFNFKIMASFLLVIVRKKRRNNQKKIFIPIDYISYLDVISMRNHAKMQK